MFSLSDKKDISFKAILPNLRYKNNKLYFISNKIIKTKNRNKFEHKIEFELSSIGSSSKLHYMNYEIQCSIIKEELQNGVKIDVSLKNINNLSKYEMQKIARYIESSVLSINIDYESDTTSDQYDNSSKYNKDENCDNSTIYEAEQEILDDNSFDYDERFNI